MGDSKNFPSRPPAQGSTPDCRSASLITKLVRSKIVLGTHALAIEAHEVERSKFRKYLCDLHHLEAGLQKGHQKSLIPDGSPPRSHRQLQVD